jgi:hypothetical protein
MGGELKTALMAAAVEMRDAPSPLVRPAATKREILHVEKRRLYYRFSTTTLL